jgi:hypothetical protein
MDSCQWNRQPDQTASGYQRGMNLSLERACNKGYLPCEAGVKLVTTVKLRQPV